MPRNRSDPRPGALAAAVIVLRDAKEPLTARELTRRMLHRGLWQSEGKTPWASVAAQIAVEILKKGSQSRFRRAGRGLFELTKAGQR